MADSNLYGLPTVQATLDSTSQLYAVTGTSGSFTDTRLPVAVLLNNTVLTGAPTVPGYLTSALAASTYLTSATAATTYLTQTNAATTYAPKASPVFTGSITGGSASISLGGSASFASIQSTPIGTTAAAAGGFTTLTNSGAFTVNGSISGPGITTLFTSPAFTGTALLVNATYTGLITPSTTVGIKGTIAADSAQAGSIGEVITATGTAVSMTTGTVANVTSISLTAGDWDVTGSVVWQCAGSTTMSAWNAGISTTSATLPTTPGPNTTSGGGFVTTAGSFQCLPVPSQRINISTTTTVFLTANAAFSVSTLTTSGTITARRRR